MNKCILIGRLTADPVARQSEGGTAITSYRLAVDRPFKKDGQPDADFLNVVAFGKGGEFAANYLKKGTKIAIEGRIQSRSYEKDGNTVYVTEIIADRHEFCESKGTGNAAKSSNGFMDASDDYGDSDVPF